MSDAAFRFPLIVGPPLASRLDDVLALLHRRGFSTGAPPAPPAAPTLSALAHALRPDGPALAFADGDSAAVLSVEGLADVRDGARARAREALAALGDAVDETLTLLGVAPAARVRALVAPASLAAAREGARVLAPAAERAAERAAAARRGDGGGGARVDLDELLAFVFPAAEQHSRSAGRLAVFAAAGPLRDGALWGGRAGARALTPRELDAEIDTVERDDVLAAFTGGRVLGDVDAVLRSAREYGGVALPRMSRAQVVALLARVPRAADGTASFHDVQALVLAARAARVRDMRQLFPPVPAAGSAAARAPAFVPRAPLLGRGTLAASGALGPPPPPPRAAGALDVWTKHSAVERTRATAAALHARSARIATLSDAASAAAAPALLANVTLLRDEGAAGTWDATAPFTRAPGLGSRVPSTADASRYSKAAKRV
jgi:hypothetical protein